MKPPSKLIAQINVGPATVLTLARQLKQSVAMLKPKLEALLADGTIVVDVRGFYSKAPKGGWIPLPRDLQGATCRFCGGRDAVCLASDEGVMKPGCASCVQPKVTKLPPKKVDTEAFLANVRRAIKMLNEVGEEVKAASVCQAMGLQPDDTNMVRIGRCLTKHFKADVPAEAMRCSA